MLHVLVQELVGCARQWEDHHVRVTISCGQGESRGKCRKTNSSFAVTSWKQVEQHQTAWNTHLVLEKPTTEAPLCVTLLSAAKNLHVSGCFLLDDLNECSLVNDRVRLQSMRHPQNAVHLRLAVSFCQNHVELLQRGLVPFSATSKGIARPVPLVALKAAECVAECTESETAERDGHDDDDVQLVKAGCCSSWTLPLVEAGCSPPKRCSGWTLPLVEAGCSPPEPDQEEAPRCTSLPDGSHEPDQKEAPRCTRLQSKCIPEYISALPPSVLQRRGQIIIERNAPFRIAGINQAAVSILSTLRGDNGLLYDSLYAATGHGVAVCVCSSNSSVKLVQACSHVNALPNRRKAIFLIDSTVLVIVQDLQDSQSPVLKQRWTTKLNSSCTSFGQRAMSPYCRHMEVLLFRPDAADLAPISRVIGAELFLIEVDHQFDFNDLDLCDVEATDDPPGIDFLNHTLGSLSGNE